MQGLERVATQVNIYADAGLKMPDDFQIAVVFHSEATKAVLSDETIDRKNPSLQGPGLKRYQELLKRVDVLWSQREEGRFGGVVEPMLQWAKIKTAEQKTQVIPCRAGVLSGVVYSNGDVSFCETHPPIGNIRNENFLQIWRSERARRLRQLVHNKECYCTNEIFLWPSIVYQPSQLAKAYLHSWKPNSE